MASATGASAAQLADQGVSDAAGKAADAARIIEVLASRGFDRSSTVLCLVFDAGGQTGEAGEELTGFYFSRDAEFFGAPFYQSVYLAAGGGLACKGLYIFKSNRRPCWKIGTLDDGKAGCAFVDGEASPLGAGPERPWRLLVAAPPWESAAEDA